MPQATHTIRDVMTASPRTLDVSATLEDAARAMLEDEIGDVLVSDGGSFCGIVTDRDITIRAVAEGRIPFETTLGEICSTDLACLAPDASIDDAVQLMRHQAVRRVPVVDGDEAIGIVSIGDLAIDLDGRSALADISKAPANR